MAEAVSLGLPGGHVISQDMTGAVDRGCRQPCWFPGHGGSCGPKAPSRPCCLTEHGGSGGPGVAVRPCWFPGNGGSCGPSAAAGHVGSRGVAGAVGLLLPPDILVLGTWREMWAWGCRQPCWFPGHGGSCGPWGGRVSMLVPRAWQKLWSGTAPAMLVPGAWQELWARCCPAAIWLLGHGGSCGPKASAGHVDSRGISGAVGPGLLPSMLVYGAWRQLWARVGCRPCWFQGHGRICGSKAPGRPCWFPWQGGTCGSRAAGRPCWFSGHGVNCGPGVACRPCWYQDIAGAVGPRLPLAILVSWSWREVWALGSPSAMLVPGA